MSTIYSSKAAEKPAETKIGSIGWRKNDADVWEEFIFAQRPGEIVGKNEWIPIAEYRANKAEESKRKAQFYRQHPDQLAQKIREKKRPGRQYVGHGDEWSGRGW